MRFSFPFLFLFLLHLIFKIFFPPPFLFCLFFFHNFLFWFFSSLLVTRVSMVGLNILFYFSFTMIFMLQFQKLVVSMVFIYFSIVMVSKLFELKSVSRLLEFQALAMVFKFNTIGKLVLFYLLLLMHFVLLIFVDLCVFVVVATWPFPWTFWTLNPSLNHNSQPTPIYFLCCYLLKYMCHEHANLHKRWVVYCRRDHKLQNNS